MVDNSAFACAHDALHLPRGKVEFLRQRLELHPVEPAAFEDPPPYLVVDVLVYNPSPFRPGEVRHIVCSQRSHLLFRGLLLEILLELIEQVPHGGID